MLLVAGKMGVAQVAPTDIRAISRNYKVITPPSSLPVTLLLVKQYLRLDITDTVEDEILTLFIETAISLFEKFTHRILLQTEFKTFRDQFYSVQFDLLRSPFVSLTSFEYKVSGLLTTVPADLYYLTDENFYSRIILQRDQVWPTDIDIEKQAIEIVFKSGIGDVGNVIPKDITTALLQTVANLYENRGDCNSSTLEKEMLPRNVIAIYNKYRILNVVAPNYRESI